MTGCILTYHHVAKAPPHHPKPHLFVPPQEFKIQMEFLHEKGFRVVTLDEIRNGLLEGKKPLPRSVAITFDDGFEDNFHYAFPILRQQGFSATIFMVAKNIRKNEGTNHENNTGDRYLTWEQLQQMNQGGLTIGAHSTTHKRLSVIGEDQAKKEIDTSKKILEQGLQQSVHWFCYPFGSFNKKVADYVRMAGFLGAASTIRDNRIKPFQLYYMPRIMVMPGISRLHFRYYFSVLYHLVHNRKNKKRWKGYI